MNCPRQIALATTSQLQPSHSTMTTCKFRARQPQRRFSIDDALTFSAVQTRHCQVQVK
jgi:hypothetical protein